MKTHVKIGLMKNKVNNILVIASCILLISCNRKNSQDNSNRKELSLAQPFSISKTTEQEYNYAVSKYSNRLLKDIEEHKKDSGIIQLPIERRWNPFVEFKDILPESDETGFKEYRYLGQFENIGFYLVQGYFWEHSECYLIDKKTGNQTITWNTPIISPKNEFFANISTSYGLEGAPNGVQIWKIIKRPENQSEPAYIEKYLELDQLIWVPIDFVWNENESLLIKVITVVNYMKYGKQDHEKNTYYLELKIN